MGGAGGPSPALFSLTHRLSLALSGAARQCKPCSSIWKTPAGPGAAAGSHQAHLAIPGPQLSGVAGSFCACSPRALQHQGWVLSLSPPSSPLLLLLTLYC